MSDIKIPIDTVKINFENFIDIENNSRIFFSGKFGIGKTYFLNDFFGKKEKKYDVFHLYPINYQISNNEDILELIKYDILVELLKKNKDVLQENVVDGISDSSLLFYTWIQKRLSINSILKSSISFGESLLDLTFEPASTLLGKLGRPLKELLQIDREFQEFKEEYRGGEKVIIEKYTDQIKSKNISETDYLSHLLSEKIRKQKDGKKSVLVLDDLDRIDPEHIFRILNILSAYFEKEHENKFGFDTIIIVADYSNLKYFFQHKYGPETDFSGYMDKFFTISPYYFDNKKAVFDKVEEITKSIKNEDPNLSISIGDSGYIKLFIWHIFSQAIDCEIMNLRSLLKTTKYQLSELRKGSYYEDHFADNFQKIFDIAIKIAIHSFSNTEIFIKNIETIMSRKDRKDKLMPFGKYSSTMLKSLGIKIPDDLHSSVTWRKYVIFKNENGFESISVSDGLGEDLFYELLIEYVKNKKYIREDYRIFG